MRVAYALACGILRHARRLCEVLAAEEGPSDSGTTDGDSNPTQPATRPKIPSVGPQSPWNDPSSHPRLRQIAVELARLGRHLAALPLDPTHRCTVTRFAVVWNYRAGNRKTATAMLGSLVRYAGTIPKRVDLDFDLLAVVSCAVAARVRGATPFDAFDGGVPLDGMEMEIQRRIWGQKRVGRGGSRVDLRRDASDDIERDGGEVWSVRGDARERRGGGGGGGWAEVRRLRQSDGVNFLDVILIYGELAPANRK